MYRKWKKTAALGLAVLIGGMMPMSTMLAAEDNTEVAQEIVTDSVSDAVPDGETISDDNESIVDEVKAEEENTGVEVNADDENTDDEVNADDGNTGDEVDADDVIADDEVDPVDEQNVGIALMAATEESEAGSIEVLESTDAPVIDIKLQGDSYIAGALGGAINFKYTNNTGWAFVCSANQGNQAIEFYYYLDKVEDITAPAREESDLNVSWSSWSQPYELTMGLSDNQNYVIYMKVVADGKITYARSEGVVVDTIKPEIGGVKEGETYPAGTTFTVTDANLDVVKVNEKVVTPESDGSYRVRANGTSCMIRAIDKAKNEKTCSITVTGGDQEEDPTENTVISESKVYALKAGVKYHLAAGNWKVDGDKSVYRGDIDFYVKEDGDYKFSK